MNFSDDEAVQIAELNEQIDTLNIPSPTFTKERHKKLMRAYLRDANADLVQKCVDEVETAPAQTLDAAVTPANVSLSATERS